MKETIYYTTKHGETFTDKEYALKREKETDERTKAWIGAMGESWHDVNQLVIDVNQTISGISMPGFQSSSTPTGALIVRVKRLCDRFSAKYKGHDYE